MEKGSNQTKTLYWNKENGSLLTDTQSCSIDSLENLMLNHGGPNYR